MAVTDNVRTSSGKEIAVGDAAPDFTLTDQRGEQVSMADYIGKHSIVLFFYPKSGTSGCTAEACAFRDEYDRFRDADAVVMGISGDDVAAQQQFTDRNNLPFLVLSDSDNKVRKLYGVPKTMGLMPGRVTYVIDREGIVRQVFNSQFNPTAHVAEALKVLAM